MSVLMRAGFQTYKHGSTLLEKGTKYADKARKKAADEIDAINKKVNAELGLSNESEKKKKGMAEDGSPLLGRSQRGKNIQDEEQTFFETYIQPCLAEFVGTSLFVFIGTMSSQDELLLSTALAHGLTIALSIYSLGSLSGGHFNPAVTLGVALSNGVPWIMAPFYLLAQLSGGILGAALMRGCLSFPGNVSGMSHNSTVYYKVMGGATILHTEEANVGAGILTETVLTYLLVLTVLMTAVDTKTKSTMNGLAIGLALSVSIIAGGSITGASLNPARSFGPAVVISDLRREVWRHHYIYWVGPLLGSGLAAAMYRLLLAHKDRRPIKF